MNLIYEIKKLLKFSSVKVAARIITNTSELQRGDLIAIAPREEQFTNPQAALEFGIADDMADFVYRDVGVVDKVDNKFVYLWTGRGGNIPGNDVDRYADAYWIAAINKYYAFMSPALGKTAPRSFKFRVDPTLQIQNITILMDVNEVHSFIQGQLQTIYEKNKIPETSQLPIELDGSRIGIRHNANKWVALHSCNIPEINEMWDGTVDESDGRHIYHDMLFNYVRKLKRHYNAPNTISNNREVRPHFMYKVISTKVPNNQYLLTMDKSGTPGAWRSFIIYDDAFGGSRMSNIRFTTPFKFSDNLLFKVQRGLKHVKNKLMKDSSSIEDYLERKNKHQLYNGLRLYYKHLKKRMREEKKHKKATSIFKPKFIKTGMEE